MSRWIVRAAVSVLVAAILLTTIPLGTVVDALRRVSLWAWTASLAVFFAGHYLNALKLHLLLGTTTASRSVCVQAQYAGLAANLGLPGLAGGDLVRAAYLVPSAGLKRVTLASVADRVIDTITVLIMVMVALPFAGMPPAIGALVRPGGWWLTIAAASAGVLLIVVARAARHTRLADKLTQSWAALSARRSAVMQAALISMVVQGGFVVTNVWLARQVGVTTGLAAWFVAWPLAKLVAVLPISLGGIGVREAALVSLLVPYGASGEAVLASGLLWQGVLAVSGLAGLAVTQVLKRRAPKGEAGAGADVRAVETFPASTTATTKKLT